MSYLTEESSVPFGFLRNVKMTRSMMEGHEVLVCAGLFDETIFLCVSFDGSEWNSHHTLQASLLFPFAHSFTLLHDTFDWSSDAVEGWGCVCDDGAAGVVCVTAKKKTAERGAAFSLTVDWL